MQVQLKLERTLFNWLSFIILCLAVMFFVKINLFMDDEVVRTQKKRKNEEANMKRPSCYSAKKRIKQEIIKFDFNT